MELSIPGYVSLLLVGPGEGEVYAIQGRIEHSGDGARFVGNKGAIVPMELEWLERAKAVTPELRGIFGDASQAYIRLSVGNLPGDFDDLPSR